MFVLFLVVFLFFVSSTCDSGMVHGRDQHWRDCHRFAGVKSDSPRGKDGVDANSVGKRYIRWWSTAGNVI